MKTEPHQSETHRNNRVAFTVIELIAVIAVLAVLAAMLLPALAGARPNSPAFQCMNNLRQLQVAWLAYSIDNNDEICPTAGTANPTAPNWVYGSMFVASEQTNVALIQQGLLWPYIKSLSPYKCPADPKKSATGIPTVRSISMNGWMNPATTPQSSGLSGPCRVFRKLSDISSPISPSQCWVLIDENHNAINDAWFVVSANPSVGPNNFNWVDVPANYHKNAGCGLSLADGHAEIKRWRDRALLSPGILLTPADASVPPVPPGYGDLRWLQARSSVPP